MKYFAILTDSLYETIDQKLLYVLMAMSLLLVLVCASVSFPRQPVEQVLQRNIGPSLQVGDVHAIDEKPFSSVARYRFTVQPGSVTGLPESPPRPGPGFRRFPTASADELAANPLAGLTGRFGFKDPVLVERQVDDDKKLQRASAEVTIDWPAVLQGHKISFLFGLWESDLFVPLGDVIMGIQVTLIDHIGGFVGVILAVIITAGFVPNMMRKGSIDLLLVKPISRPLLLIYKYLGGLAFVLFNAVVLVGSSWIVFGWTLGNWNLWYLASIGVLIFYFAVLYSVSVLVGVMTQSPMAATLVTIIFWGAMIGVNVLYTLTHNIQTSAIFPESVVTASSVAHFLLPRLADLSALNQYALAEANSAPLWIDERMRQTVAKFSWTEALATSGAFIAVMLSLACWRFSRRDY
jgi:ABC-type transport system involved in multi-copper enzyme maturation permease subunit